MDRIDRLLQMVNNLEKPPKVHFLRDGYCVQCAGSCTAHSSEDAVIIINDIPKDYVFIPPDITVFANDGPVVSTKVKKKQTIKQAKDTPYSRLFGHR